MNSVNESRLLIEVESFVWDMTNVQRRPKYFYEDLADLLIGFDSVYNDEYYYFGWIEVLIALLYDFESYLDNREKLIQHLRYIPFSQFQQNFSQYVLKHQRKLADHRYSEKKNREQLEQRMRDISNQYARILVIRVDLAYKKKYQHLINIEDFDKDMQRLRRYIHNQDTVFHGLIESAWALEQGEDKGYHCHLLLVYKGHEHQKTYGIAKRVGELWQKTTKDKGYYFNCHDRDYLRSYEDKGILGIGMIYRNDKQQVENMLNTVSYLVRPEKEDQHLRVKTRKRMRTFG